MADNVGMTMLAASLGFVTGTVAACVAAVLFLYSRSLERAFFPWAIILKTIPVLAIAPLLTIWLGFGIAPKVAIAAIACFFPTLVNVTRGLRSLDASLLDFMQVIQAPPLQVFWHARLYAAAPYLFSAMKITVGMAVIGAIVAEFTGANVGIGTLIVNAGYQQDTAMLFSAITVTSLATIVLFYLVTALEKLMLFWPGARLDR
jgi:NitT/TauT family transport system permease protein